jgi:cytidylate kinase
MAEPAGGDRAALRTVVTIDGPAGAGKSTTAREVARRLGYRYLDSGALYRALTWALLDAGLPEEGWPDLDARALDDLGIEVRPEGETLVVRHRGRRLESELRTDRVTALVSSAARLPAVRDWLLGHQRALGRWGRLVADGRDMGTVVFPEAGTKVFLEADLTERARRRLRDQGVSAPDADATAREAERLEARDRKDMTRETAPLRAAPDAVRLDTTGLDFDAQVEAVVALALEADPESGGGETR